MRLGRSGMVFLAPRSRSPSSLAETRATSRSCRQVSLHLAVAVRVPGDYVYARSTVAHHHPYDLRCLLRIN